MITKLQKSDKNAYQINNTSLLRYSGKSKAAFIPYGITEIGEKAFEGCKELEIILIPETVKKIGHEAFQGCENLKNINIPNSVNYIGEHVFNDCKKLKRLYLPDSVKECHLLGNLCLNYFRMPLSLWNKGILIDTVIKNMVLGLPEDINNLEFLLNLKVLDFGMPSYPSITFESNNSEDFVCIDGCLVSWSSYETPSGDEFEGVVESVSDLSLNIPSDVEVLNYHCVSERRHIPLYIPGTVGYIHPEAFETWSEPILVTPKSNYQHLINILSSNTNDIKIYDV